MNIEVWYIIVMSLSGALGALGGTQISDEIKGQKWIRRFMLPILLGLFCFFVGHFDWWRCLILTGGLIGAFCLPYGSRTPYWLKTLVGMTYMLPTIALGHFSIWQIVSPVIFIGLFKLSNIKWFSNFVVWKIWEFVIFALIGITIVSLTHLHSIQ